MKRIAASLLFLLAGCDSLLGIECDCPVPGQENHPLDEQLESADGKRRLQISDGVVEVVNEDGSTKRYSLGADRNESFFNRATCDQRPLGYGLRTVEAEVTLRTTRGRIRAVPLGDTRLVDVAVAHPTDARVTVASETEIVVEIDNILAQPTISLSWKLVTPGQASIDETVFVHYATSPFCTGDCTWPSTSSSCL